MEAITNCGKMSPANVNLQYDATTFPKVTGLKHPQRKALNEHTSNQIVNLPSATCVPQKHENVILASFWKGNPQQNRNFMAYFLWSLP